MVSENARRIVVIRDIPSNIIEEAILILKSEPGGRGERKDRNLTSMGQKNENDYLLKEAELIIDNYINEGKMKAEKRRRDNLKREMLKKKLSSNFVINMALFSSVIILVFVILKLL